jgi:hypothetical protein
MPDNAFGPRAGGASASLAVTASPAALSLPAAIAQGGGTIRLLTSGSQLIFLRFDGTNAAVTDMPMLPGTVEVFALAPGMSISAIAAATGTTLYATAGAGV